MAWPSLSDLRIVQSHFRRYDNALRLRVSAEEASVVLIERKTYRGRIGSFGPGGVDWQPDYGRRKEEGHVLVGSIHAGAFDEACLLDALKEADTWGRWDSNTKPLWQRVEEADEAKKAAKVRARKEGLRYKSSEFYDRFVWKMKSRTNVPVAIS